MASPLAGETLADALVSAYKNSQLLEQNRATLRAADEGVAQAVAALRPVLAWTTSYNYNHTNQVSTQSRDRQTASAQLSASMTIFDFGRSRLAIEMQKEAVLGTREALLTVEQDVLLSAISAYTSVRSAAEQVSITQNSVRVFSEELQASRDRFEVGEVTQTDVAQAQAAQAQARASLAVAQGNYQIARETFKATVGQYPGNLARLPARPKIPARMTDAEETALRNNPSVKQAKHSLRVAELGIDAAAAERRPTINATVGFTNSEGANRTTAAGINMSQTIYSGGLRSSQHRAALAQRDQARASLQQIGITLSQSIGQTWSEIDVYRIQIGAYGEQITAAEIAWNGVREEARLGTRTTLDVLTAEQTLLEARADRIDAEANLEVAYYKLLSNMGLLTVENLKLGIPTYDPAAYYDAVQNAPYTSTRGQSLDRVLRAIGKSP